MSKIIDDIYWIEVNIKNEIFYFFVTEPYLYSNISESYGKIIYSTTPFFTKGNVNIIENKTNLYKTYLRNENDVMYGVLDLEINSYATKFGFEKGCLIDENLNKIIRKEVIQIQKSKEIILIEDYKNYERLFNEISTFYETNIEDLKLTGGGQLFNKKLNDMHDLDLVVTIYSYEQLEKINLLKKPKYAKNVTEFNRIWPLRWYSFNNEIVCPFFIYGKIGIPIEEVQYTGENFNGVLTIKNDEYGIFNMPIYQIDNQIKYIAFRLTIVRGWFKLGDKIKINNGKVYKIKKGLLKENTVIIINDFSSQLIIKERNL